MRRSAEENEGGGVGGLSGAEGVCGEGGDEPGHVNPLRLDLAV